MSVFLCQSSIYVEINMHMSNKEETIIQVATQLFSQYGYHAVGVDTIVAESNVAKMTFYRYFPSKDILIEKVLLERNQKLQEEILRHISVHKNPMSRLKAIFEWHENWFKSENFHGCMFIKAIDEYPATDSRMRIAAKEYKTWLDALVKSNLKEIGGKKAAELSTFVLSVLDGLTINGNLFPESISINMKLAWQQIQHLVNAEK